MADEAPDAPAMDAPPPESPPREPAEELEAMRKALAKANKEAETARTELKTVKPLADRARALEDANKTELERLTEQLNAERAKGSEAVTANQKLQVAMDKAPDGASMETVRWVAGRLQGASQEELEADAGDLFARFTAAPSPPAVNGQRTPVENLRPGALPTTPQPSLLDQIAAAEAKGDWKTAMYLKSQHTQQRRVEQPQ